MIDDGKIKVMIIDDSLSMRLFLSSLFSRSSKFKVVATAENPIDAMQQLKIMTPDVITLDVEMPEMDGITFLKKIMRLKPLPVVMISTLTAEGSATAIEAFDYGAIDVVGKPSHKATELSNSQNEILDKVEAASFAHVGQANPKEINKKTNLLSYEKCKVIDDILPLNRSKSVCNKKIITIASSTGGPPALKSILKEIVDLKTPPILIVQHIGMGFSKGLALNINKISALTTVEAADGQVLNDGHVYIAPSGKHLGVKQNAAGKLVCMILDFEKVNRHKPSADILFRTALQTCGKSTLGIILTGMGDDGARCLKELYQIGAETIVQNEDSCVVYGMPRVALEMEPGHRCLNLKQISKSIKDYSL